MKNPIQPQAKKEDSTGTNATCMVRSIVTAACALPLPAAEPSAQSSITDSQRLRWILEHHVSFEVLYEDMYWSDCAAEDAHQQILREIDSRLSKEPSHD